MEDNSKAHIAMPVNDAGMNMYPHPLETNRALIRVVLFLRVVGLIVCALAASMTITSKQTKKILILEVTAKFTDSKAFEAMAAATAACAVYLLIQSLITAMALCQSTPPTGACNRLSAWSTFLADQFITYVVLGVAAASSEVAYIAKNGSSKVGWSPVCQSFNSFCNHVGGAIVLTHLAVLLMAICSAISAFRLFSEYGRRY